MTICSSISCLLLFVLAEQQQPCLSFQFATTSTKRQHLTLQGLQSCRTKASVRHLYASLSSLADSSALSSDDDGSNEEESSSVGGVQVAPPVSRLRRLKDLMWIREAREDLTAAEFACSVEAQQQERDARRKRAVDYEKLLTQLNRRIRDMGCEGEMANEETPFSCYLQSGVGMGSIVYTDEQREALLQRMLQTRELLLEVMRGHELFEEDEMPFAFTLPEIRMEIPKEDDPTSFGPKLYVRDDGTVDWDGALQDREALRKFGTAVWARINGRDPETVDELSDIGTGHGHKPKNVTASIEETAEIKAARQKLDELRLQLDRMERAHIALLNSAISAGQAVANVNLASLAPAQRNKIRSSAEEVEKMKEKVTYQSLLYELERVYSYLMKELGNPALTGYIPLQDRLNVAEFGLLESQIEGFRRQIEAGESIDADVQAVVTEQFSDFKRRLGIDYYVTGFSFDRDAILRWLGELGDKTKKGLAFYGKGCRLFWNDIVFCLSLINRAAQGYTLKPREVRTIR